MNISDIKQFQDTQRPPLILDHEVSLEEAVKHMAEKEFGAVVVTQDNKYRGLVTERSILKDVLAQSKKMGNLALKDILRSDAPTAQADDDAMEKLELLNSSEFRHMAVLNDKNEFVGMLSQGDFAAWTWPKALTQATEMTKAGVSENYQPFFITAALLIYGVGVTIYAFAKACF